MLQFSKISKKDIERYNKYRQKAPSNASEASFATLFIWNGYYDLECSANGEFFFLRFSVKNRAPSYFFPIGDGDIKRAIDELSEYAEAKGEKLAFRLVSKDNKDKLISLYGDSYVVDSPDNSRLMALFHNFCESNGIVHNNDEIFAYLHSYEEKTEQLTLFD